MTINPKLSGGLGVDDAAMVTVGDHRGIELELTVPEDIDFTTCDRFDGLPYFQTWSYDSGGGRNHQGPGQHRHRESVSLSRSNRHTSASP